MTLADPNEKAASWDTTGAREWIGPGGEVHRAPLLQPVEYEHRQARDPAIEQPASTLPREERPVTAPHGRPEPSAMDEFNRKFDEWARRW